MALLVTDFFSIDMNPTCCIWGVLLQVKKNLARGWVEKIA